MFFGDARDMSHVARYHGYCRHHQPRAIFTRLFTLRHYYAGFDTISFRRLRRHDIDFAADIYAFDASITLQPSPFVAATPLSLSPPPRLYDAPFATPPPPPLRRLQQRAAAPYARRKKEKATARQACARRAERAWRGAMQRRQEF
jgi:hypothetical protein